MDGWFAILPPFNSSSAIYQDDGGVIIEGCVKRNPVKAWKYFHILKSNSGGHKDKEETQTTTQQTNVRQEARSIQCWEIIHAYNKDKKP